MTSQSYRDETLCEGDCTQSKDTPPHTHTLFLVTSFHVALKGGVIPPKDEWRHIH